MYAQTSWQAVHVELHALRVVDPNVPHGEVYIECTPEQWPDRKRKAILAHPEWFAGMKFPIVGTRKAVL